MIQEIIAWLIIIAAFGMLILHVLRFFNLTGKKNTKPGTCSGCSSGCEMKEIHQISKEKIVSTDQYRYYL